MDDAQGQVSAREGAGAAHENLSPDPEINRWSFVDPFIVALTAPLMAYPGIADVDTGAGALPFALVVVLTMLASHCFDTRLMWDAAEKNND